MKFPGYGYRRFATQLQWDGLLVNHKRALRVAHEESLLCQLKRRFVVTTDSGHGLRTHPNMQEGKVLGGFDDACVSDITYVRLPTSFAYLGCILDGFSRRCIGWALPGHRLPRRLYPSFRPCNAVRIRGLRRRTGAGGGQGEPVGEGQSVRRRDGRKLLQHAQPRGRYDSRATKRSRTPRQASAAS